MLDKDLFAHGIGIVKSKNAITVRELALSLGVCETKAINLLEQLVECQFIDCFDGFYARCDLVSFN